MQPRPLPRIAVTALTHDHIDGSAAMADVIKDLYVLAGKPFPFASAEAWVEYFHDAHDDIVTKFGTVNCVLQSKEALQMAAHAYVARRAKEGYEYLEAKFAPQYHTFGGLTMSEVVDTVCGSLWIAGISHGLKVLPQVCIGREATPEVGMEIAKLVLDYDGDVALDLACDEAGHPPEKHLPAYALTFGTRVMRDCHAGEWVAREPTETYRARLLKNLRTAIVDLRCHGVGHAIPLIDDPELIKRVVDTGVRISGCPLSNLVCGSIKDIRELGIDQLLDAGVMYTLNTDDDLFLPPMPAVIDAVQEAYGVNHSTVLTLETIGRNARFQGGSMKADR